MSGGVSGSIGLPELNIAAFKKDGPKTKTTSLFSSAKPKDSPPPKDLPTAPKIKPETLVNASKLAKTTAPTTAPKTTAAPPKVDTEKLAKLIQDTPGKMSDLEGKIASYAEGATKLAADPKAKGYTEGMASSLQTRLSLQKDVQERLAALETGEAPKHLSAKDINDLRTKLIGMAIDLALPELAHARNQESSLSPETNSQLQLRGVIGQGIQNTPSLSQEHDKLVALLKDLRTTFAGKPEEAGQVTGAFLKALSETSVGRDKSMAPLDKLQTFNALTQALSKGDISVGSMPLLRSDDPGFAKLMSGLRSNHYAGDAARNFLLSLDPVAHRNLLTDLQGLHEQGGLQGKSLSELRNMLPEGLRADFDKAVDKGRAAAKLRDDFEDQRTRTARSLGSENGHLAESSVLMKAKGMRVLNDSGLSIKADDTTIDKQLKTLAKTNKEGAFQVTRLALMMEKLAAAEEEALGRNQFGLNTNEKFDASAIMQVTGVTEKDLQAMGYSTDGGVDGLEKNMERLGKAGFEDVGQVKDVMTRMRGMKAVMENRGIQGNMHAEFQMQTAAVGKLLQKEIASDAMQMVGATLGDDLSKDPGVALKQAMTGIATGIQTALFKTETGETSDLAELLNGLQEDIQMFDKGIASLGKDLTNVEKEIGRQQRLLGFLTDGSGKIDPKNPSGLESSKLILKALQLDDAIQNMSDGAWKDSAIAERDRTLKELKGFDEKLMKRTWTGKSIFNRSEPPTIQQLRALEPQARAIIYIRETGPNKMAEIREDMTKFGLTRDALVAERREVAPRLFNAMERLVHLAVATNIPYDQAETTVEGAYNPSYDMSGKRDKVEALLKEWGVDTEAFAVEIDHAINTPITGKTLDQWRVDAGRGSFDQVLETGFVAKEPSSAKKKFGDFAMAGLMLLANKSQITSQARLELEAMVDSLPKNSKFDLSSGTEISLNTGRIPVEPTATVTVRGRISGSVFKSMVIETGSSGEIKLTGMLGGTAKLGVDLQASLDPLKMTGSEVTLLGGGKLESRVGAELSLDGGYEGAGGFQISFPATPEGKKAAIEAILKLTERQKPSAEIFEQATDVASFRRHKGDFGGKAQLFANVSAFWQPGGNDGDMFEDIGGDNSAYKSGASNKHGVGAGAQIEARAGVGGKSEITTSLDKSTVKTETSSFVSVGGKVAIYAQTFSALGMLSNVGMTESGAQKGMDQQFDKDSSTKVDGAWSGGNATVPYELVNLSAEVRVTTINKKKLEFAVVGTESREVLAKAEMKELTDGANTSTIHHLMAALPDDMLKSIKDDPKKIGPIREMFDEISRIGLSSAMIEVTYNIKPDQLALANELFREADLAMESGDKSTANKLMAAAKGIVDDRDNYTPAKISLIDKTSVKDVANRGMAVLAKVDIVSNVGTERVMMSVTL
jgi:hypothetical protein